MLQLAPRALLLSCQCSQCDSKNVLTDSILSRTAREHQARGHFGLPLSNVRASRLRANAAERLQQERLAREAKRHLASAGKLLPYVLCNLQLLYQGHVA